MQMTNDKGKVEKASERAETGLDYGLSVNGASHLMGQVVRYDVGIVFNPAYTMVCRIAKKWLPVRAAPGARER